jgi:hypothetical protein
MKNSGLKNEAQVAKIFVSGSNALPAKNANGVRLFEQSDLRDGIISGKLIRPKYNTKELKKSIDTEIFELLPNAPTPQPDTVPRPLYNSALEQIDDLTAEVQRLNIDVNDLSAKVSELEIVSESLKIEADNQILKANVSEQQAITANEQVATTTIDLTNAIQNSINEAVQRVSLFARNESLEQEVANLREQLFGLAAQTAEGAQSGGNNLFTVKVIGGGSDPDYDIKATSSHWDRKGEDTLNVQLEVNNVTAENKITNIQFNFTNGPKWIKVRQGYSTTIEPQVSAVYGLKFDNDVIGTMDPKRVDALIGKKWSTKAKDHTNTQLQVKATFADGSTDTVILRTKLRKNRKG